MNFYISDMHFGHERAIEFDKRPFANVEEMDRMLIELWNAKIQPENSVYILGDFAFRNKRPEEWYLRQLKGKKYLIIGNHDIKLLKNETAMSCFETAEKMMHVSDNGNQICLCHFPLAEWNGYYRGAWHIYGHIHDAKKETYEFMKNRERALNAGCMINNYAPASFRELVVNNERLKKEE